ncbi:MAG: hypothetical protein ACOH2K_14995 [Burkholderiaceae bacterium]
MNVFVILNYTLGGMQDMAVFRSRAGADAYLADKTIQGRVEVLSIIVFGDLSESGVVFTASTYDPSHDIHNFEGVYGDYKRAKQVVGAKGSVLRREISDND